MNQLRLVIQDDTEAMTDAVRACGGSKVVAGWLWPTIDIYKAQKKLDDCLNANRSEKLSLAENLFILRKAREAGYHSAKHWIDEVTGYLPSEPMEPEVEAAKMQRTAAELIGQLADITARLEKLNVKPSLSSLARGPRR